jgi:hypothetical protein
MSARKNSPQWKLNVPWINEDGYFVPSKFPIDGQLKRTLSEDCEEFRKACSVLQTMYQDGRIDAGVYLLGLLRYYQHDLERLIIVVRYLEYFRTVECADALFAEISRVKSSHTTRTYIKTILEVLKEFPYAMVKEGFERLAEDKNFSYKMRRKFRGILEMIEYRREMG